MAETKNIKQRTGGRKRTSARRSSSRTPKRSDMPGWLSLCIVLLISAAALYCTIIFFFLPYFYRFHPCYGNKQYEIYLPLGFSVYGIDISRHQGNIDWEKFKNENPADAPISFVYIKATEGSDFTDVNFTDNFNNAREHGFIRGAYHYFSLHSTGLAQAEMFIKTVKLQKGDLPPVVDIEVKPKDKTKFLQELKTFITKIEEHYGVKPILYTYSKYKPRYLTDKFFARYPSWVAHYNVDSLGKDVEWLIWQCSEMGEVPGIPENVDINIFNGSRQQFESLLIK